MYMVRWGVHRPYFENLNPNSTNSEIKAMREEIKKIINKYFNEMDISESIIDEMLSIEPNKIKILSADELTKYRITVMDANHEEKMIAEEAQRYNITSGIYRQRKAITDKKCGYFHVAAREKRLPEFWKCEKMTMLNISESEYNLRESKAQAKCFKIEAGPNRGQCYYDATILGK